jgi:TonB family protein
MATAAMAASPNNAQVAQLAELLKAMNVTADGTLTKISWSVPESQIEQMVQASQSANQVRQQNATPPKVRPGIRTETHNAPPADSVPGRIRVGANVQQAKLLQQTAPEYPPLAKQARISGVVRLNAIIGKDGSVENLTVLSGHPLLVQPAMESVKNWVYEPTLLNGKAVEVVTQVEVNFTLEP